MSGRRNAQRLALNLEDEVSISLPENGTTGYPLVARYGSGAATEHGNQADTVDIGVIGWRVSDGAR